MEDLMKDLLIVLGRIVTILPLLLFVTIFMGKRAIGELPIFDFLIILTLGAVVGADIADPNIKHLPTAFTIVVIGIFQRLVARWKIKNRKFGKLITFEPTLVVQNGKLLKENISRIHYSIDNVLQMLREKNTFDLNEVELAIIEANGALSVLKKDEKQTVTKEDMKLTSSSPSISFPVMMEGKIYDNTLRYFQVDETWLKQQLAHKGIITYENIFYISLNRNLDLSISFNDEKNEKLPPLYH
ncbi:DUF421 domain-containing protein [Metabacillus endolithicus]|uniref:DUF421 domain-containing protein n=1 Tax=Metabacillus endolithicus TaxID=1535204 RepID=A0ABW5C2W2_9BACI